MNQFVCPSCGNELRTSAAIAADQAITCPACQKSFVASKQPAKSSPVAVGGSRRFGLVTVVAAVVVVGLVVAAFVWPGFLRLGGLSPAALANQAQARNLLSFAPENSSMVAGIRIGHVRKQPELQNAWNKLRQYLTQLQSVPVEAHEVIADADMVLLAGNGGPTGSAVCVVSTEHPLDAPKVKKALGVGPARTHQGIAVCPCDEIIAGRPGSLAFPTDRIAMLGLMPPEHLARAVARATEPRLSPDLKAQVDQVSGSVIWCAVQFDDDAKQALRKLNEKVAFLALLVKEVGTLGPIAVRGKGAVVTLDVADAQKVKLSVGFTCHDAADAAEMKVAVYNLWVNHGKSLGLLLGQRFGKLLGEVSDTFDLEQRDNSVLLSVQVNQATLESLLDAAPLLNFANPK